MEEDTKHKESTKTKTPSYDKWWQPPFDSTTNFSLLGWIADKSGYNVNSRKKVDLILDD